MSSPRKHAVIRAKSARVEMLGEDRNVQAMSRVPPRLELWRIRQESSLRWMSVDLCDRVISHPLIVNQKDVWVMSLYHRPLITRFTLGGRTSRVSPVSQLKYGGPPIQGWLPLSPLSSTQSSGGVSRVSPTRGP